MNGIALLSEVANPPAVLLPCPELENEWWYYHGHLQSGNRWFGFHLAFFRRLADRITIGSFLPLRLFTNHVRCAHFAVTDISRKQFSYGHQLSVLAGAGEASDEYRVWLDGWSAQGAGEHHRLVARIRGVELQLNLAAVKPHVWHQHQDLVSGRSEPRPLHFSFPRMDATGTLVLGRESLSVTGQAWMDREFGGLCLDRNVHGWDWFAMQFADGQELMIHQIHNNHREPIPSSTATFVDAANRVRRLSLDEFQVTPLENWRSGRTGNSYPIRWQITCPSLAADLQVASCVRCCELDTRGSTSLIYWEGPACVFGRLCGRPVRGRCFVELVGHDEVRRLGLYDYSAQNLGLASFLADHVFLRLYGPGISVAEQT